MTLLEEMALQTQGGGMQRLKLLQVRTHAPNQPLLIPCLKQRTLAVSDLYSLLQAYSALLGTLPRRFTWFLPCPLLFFSPCHPSFAGYG